MLKTLQKIGDNFPYCLVIVDNTDKLRPCVYANKKFSENTGFDHSFVVGKNLSFLQGELTDIETVLFMKKCFKEGVSCVQDIVNYKKDGTPFLNRLLMLPFGDKGRDYYLGFQNDITKDKGLDYSNESLKSIKDSEVKHVVNNSLAVIFGVLASESYRKSHPEEAVIELEKAFKRILDYILKIESLSDFENFKYI